MLIPAGNGQQVNIWCTGIRMLPGVSQEYQAHLDQKVHGRFKPVTRSLLKEFKELLPEDERNTANLSSMVIVDARGPTSAKPPRDQMLFHHVGTHPTIMQQALDSNEFIQDIGRQVESQWPKRTMNSDQGHIGICVFCQSGKHRSVAWAYLLQALLLSYGYNAIVSQTAMNLDNTCGQGPCEFCMAATPHSILNQAIVKLSLVKPCD